MKDLLEYDVSVNRRGRAMDDEGNAWRSGMGRGVYRGRDVPVGGSGQPKRTAKEAEQVKAISMAFTENPQNSFLRGVFRLTGKTPLRLSDKQREALRRTLHKMKMHKEAKLFEERCGMKGLLERIEQQLCEEPKKGAGFTTKDLAKLLNNKTREIDRALEKHFGYSANDNYGDPSFDDAWDENKKKVVLNFSSSSGVNLDDYNIKDEPSASFAIAVTLDISKMSDNGDGIRVSYEWAADNGDFDKSGEWTGEGNADSIAPSWMQRGRVDPLLYNDSVDVSVTFNDSGSKENGKLMDVNISDILKPSRLIDKIAKQHKYEVFPIFDFSVNAD